MPVVQQFVGRDTIGLQQPSEEMKADLCEKPESKLSQTPFSLNKLQKNRECGSSTAVYRL